MTTENVTKLPPQKTLVSLVKQIEAAKQKTGTIAGDLGEAISSAVEKHNVHAGALKLVAKLHRMDAVKLMAFLTHFDDYRQKMELDKLAAPDLPGMEDEADDAAAGEAKTPEPEPEPAPGVH